MSSILEDVPMLNFICEPSQYSLLRRANSHGFAALPDELLLEVLSYFPPNPLTISPASKTEIIRRETLHSLSEVCQNLRRFFRPYLWQCVEVYAGMRAGGQELNHATMSFYRRGRKAKKHFAKELLRQLNVVTIQDPGLAQYVRNVHIEVNAATLRPIFDELGRCFSLFPNLHAVKIITQLSHVDQADTGIIAAVTRGFKKRITFPQIRSAILSPSIHPLIAVCPNLESLTTSGRSPFLLKLIQALTGLQILSCPVDLAMAAAIAEYLPSLQQISLEYCLDYTEGDYTTDFIKTVRSFPNLRTLFVHLGPYGFPFVSKRTLTPALLNLPLLDRPHLKKVVFIEISGYPEEILFL